MQGIPVHAKPAHDLPLHHDVSMLVLGVGLAVFALVLYDAYRQHWV